MKNNRAIFVFLALVSLSVVNLACETEIATSTRFVAPTQQAILNETPASGSQISTLPIITTDPVEPTSSAQSARAAAQAVDVSVKTSEGAATSNPITETATPQSKLIVRSSDATPTPHPLVVAVPKPDSSLNPTSPPAIDDPVSISVESLEPTPTTLPVPSTESLVSAQEPTPTPIQSTVLSKDPYPVVSIGHITPQVSIVGELVQLVNAKSSVPPSGRSMMAVIDWGDGSGFVPATVIQKTGDILATHTYSEPGNFTVTLRVRVDQGGESSDSMPVIAYIPPTSTPVPTITPTPTTVPTPSPVWDPVGSMVASQRDHAATLMNNGKVMVIGIYATHLGPYSKLVEVYDPATGTFSATGNISKSHGSYPTATVMADGRVLVVGGALALSTAEIYDPATGTFSTTGSLSVGRCAHTAMLLNDGRVLIAGGVDNYWYGNKVAVSEIYDPVTGTFSVIGSLATARSMLTSTMLPNGEVLIFGGISEDSSGGELSVELFDPIMETFSPAGTILEPRTTSLWWTGAPLLANGKILILGGRPTSTELYDPATQTSVETGTMNFKHRASTVTVLSTGQVLVAGGSLYLDSTEIYDPVAGTFRISESLGTARQQHTATLLQNGDVLIIGGAIEGAAHTETAEIFHYR
ncbi:MAG: hypothetical protein HOJ22_06280 [Chloroflexi bacterium]|nr:hypothetical protein [Chloroflexota bacterium]MBT5627880.1 hypothetical protein [Chloroflexota bacterium]